MSTSTKVNIKSLPTTTEVKIGDFLILETELGTKLLDFENFVITEFNTTFNGTLSGHTADIATNLSKITAISGLLSGADATINIGTSAVGVSALGVGTNAPTTALHVMGTDPRVRAEATDGNHPGFELAENSTRKWIVFNRPSSESAYDESDQLVFKTDTVERMTLQQDGKLGIGTMIPTTLLHLSAHNGAVTVEDAATATVHFNSNHTSTGRNWSIQSVGTTGNFRIYDSTGSVSVVDITSGGNVGIGTSSPTTSLHLGSVSACISINEHVSTPAAPSPGSQANIYIKGDKLVLQFDDGGTVRYKYLDLTGTGVTWVHSTTAP